MKIVFLTFFFTKNGGLSYADVFIKYFQVTFISLHHSILLLCVEN